MVALVGSTVSSDAAKKAKDKDDAPSGPPKYPVDSYSATAPYNCQTTEAVIRSAAEALAKEIMNKKGSSPTQVELLGLMATGEKKYIEVVAKALDGFRSVPYDGKSLQSTLTDKQLGSWSTAYATIALAEYYYMTKDATILPALKTYTLSLVEGQDPAGLYGHKMKNPEKNRAPGYGQMNQVSLACYLGMLLARKCGVDVPGLPEAIARSRAYVEFYVNKGGFPYGFHGPRNFDFNNNGTSGLAAVCMAMEGNKAAALFFAKMAAAAPKPGTGHASSLFSSYWSPAGANVAGPEVTKAMFPEVVQYFTSHQNSDGSIKKVYNEGHLGGAALLAYCLPLKALLITGREADESLWLDEKEAKAAVNMDTLNAGRSMEQLLVLFGHDNPVVRHNAFAEIESLLGLDASSLKKSSKPPKSARGQAKAKKGAESVAANTEKFMAVFPQIEKMITSGSLHEQETALGCYLFGCPDADLKKRLDTIASLLRDKNKADEVRVAAVKALASQPTQIQSYFDDILAFLLEDRPNDYFGWVDVEISEGIGSIIGGTRSTAAMADSDANPDDPEQEVEGDDVPGVNGDQAKPFLGRFAADKEIFYRAARRLMEHRLQNTRGVGVRMVRNIPREDLYQVINELDHILRDDDRNYYSYHNPRTAKAPAAEIYVENNIREGINYIVDNILDAPGKSSFKLMALMQTLPKYGVHAKPVIPKVLENKWVKVMYAQHENSGGGRFYDQFQEMLKNIENSTTGPELISVEEIKKEEAQSVGR